MDEQNTWMVETLMGLKGSLGEMKGDLSGLRSDVSEVKKDVGDIRNDMSDVKTDVASLKTAFEAHLTEDKSWTIRVAGLESKVDAIATKDIPDLRQQLAVQNWFKSNRNKVLAAVAAAALTGIGSIFGTLLLEKLKMAEAPSMVNNVQASPSTHHHKPATPEPVAAPAPAPDEATAH